VENIPFQAERHSARRQKLFALPPEWRSLSQRNTVRIHNGMVFGFRPESRSSSTGFPTRTQGSPKTFFEEFSLKFKLCILVC
jgi:hypothetical protein